MKIVHFILPGVALVSVAAWIASQRQSIASLEMETAGLRQHIAAALSDTGSGHSPSSIRKREKPISAKNSFDWAKIAAWQSGTESGRDMGDMRAMMRFQQQLQEMSKDEILAALQEIAALDISEKSRHQLEMIFLGPLIQKDPEHALTAYIDRLKNSDPGFEYQLSSAFGEWAKKDPAASAAWFDRQIAAGKFESRSLDGKNGARVRFEASLLGPLFGSDPAAAERRIATYPDGSKPDILKRIDIAQMDPAHRKSYAGMVRGQMSPEDVPETIANMASKIAYPGDYAAISAFLSEIGADPAERAASVEEAGQARLQMASHQKKLGRGDVDAMREWAATQSPDTVDSATGKILGNFALHGNGFTFDDAAAMALDYHEGGAGDALLVSLLDSRIARQNREQAARLAEKITDAAVREETLSKLNRNR